MKVRRKQGGTTQAVEDFFDKTELLGHSTKGMPGWFSVNAVAVETGKHRNTVRAVMNGLAKVGALESATVYVRDGYVRGAYVRVYRKVEAKWAPPHAGISKGVASAA